MDDFEGRFEKKICRFIRAQIKRLFFFSNNPIKSSKNWFFPNFFYIFLLIFVCKLQKIWVSDLRRNLRCVPYAQKWVYFENFEKTPNFGRIVRTPKIFFRVLQIIYRVLQVPIFRNNFRFGGKVFTFSLQAV